MAKDKIIHIQSEFISAEISREGAELKSLFDLDSGVEYLWQGSHVVYPWSSQLMFPIVGKLRDDQYRLGRKFYRLAKDGFAKDLVFDVKSQRRDMVSLTLSNTKDTLLGFPFLFDLVVTYKVYGPKLTVSIDIKNLDKKEMFFSLGFAPVFNLPLSKNDESIDDYLLEFSREEDRGAYFLDNGLVNFYHTDNKRVISDRELAFSNGSFKNGEMIFKDVNSSVVTLKNKINEKSVWIEYENAPYLSIWSYPGAPFVRIAPSYGVTDAVDSNYDFYMKEGLVDLEQEKSFKMEMTIHIR